MKIACDKCEKVVHEDKTRDWVAIRTVHSKYNLCPDCSNGFYNSVDRLYPKSISETEYSYGEGRLKVELTDKGIVLTYTDGEVNHQLGLTVRDLMERMGYERRRL